MSDDDLQLGTENGPILLGSRAPNLMAPDRGDEWVTQSTSPAVQGPSRTTNLIPKRCNRFTHEFLAVEPKKKIEKNNLA